MPTEPHLQNPQARHRPSSHTPREFPHLSVLGLLLHAPRRPGIVLLTGCYGDPQTVDTNALCKVNAQAEVETVHITTMNNWEAVYVARVPTLQAEASHHQEPSAR